ncbi:hypothetical protein [Campylobacter concisus]|uniref:hypothetical protein n=1 Tax=Campylobacter concisus TaxID=199 RepID=UPI00112FD034|nr:hypothetical protein [Campylobacter concisus]
MKPYKYARIFSLQAAQKLTLHLNLNLQHTGKKLHENKFGKQILLCLPNSSLLLSGFIFAKCIKF